MRRSLLALTAALLLLLSACGGEKGLFIQTDEESGTISVTAKNAKEMEVTGHITMGENQILIFSPNLEKGHLKIHITGDNQESVYDESISGRVLSTCYLEPGEYDVSIWGEKGATGTMLLFPQDQQEFIEQDEALSNILENAEKMNEMDEIEDIDEILDAVQETTES